MRPTVEIGGVPRSVREVSFTKGINEPGSLSLDLKDGPTPSNYQKTAISLAGRSFLGRVEVPSSGVSVQGSSLKVSGSGWLKRLQDYVTPSSTLTAVALNAAIDEILLHSPFTRGTVDSFTYLDDLDVAPDDIYDALSLTLNDVHVAYNPAIDTQATALMGTAHFCAPEYRTCFWNGSRFFIFYVNGTNKICYVSSADGTTWAAETDTGYTASSGYYSVLYYGSVVYLFFYDGANTDLYTGTIAGSVVTFTLKKDNVLAGWMAGNATVTPDGDIFAVATSKHMYRSQDGGANWSDVVTLDFTPVALIPVCRTGVTPWSSINDVAYVFYGAVTQSLGVGFWNEGTGLEGGNFEIANSLGASYNISVATKKDGYTYIAYCGSATGNLGIIKLSGTDDGTNWEHWHYTYTPSKKPGARSLFSLSVTSGGQVWLTLIGTDNKIWYANIESLTTEPTWTELTGITVNNTCHIASPQTGRFDGETAIFFAATDTSNDISYAVLEYRGLRSHAVNGDTLATPYVTSANYTGSGGFVKWGSAYSVFSGSSTGASLTILDSVGAVLVSGLAPPVDLDAAGITDATIALKWFLGATQVNELTSWRLTEMISPVDLAVDYHTCWQALIGQIVAVTGAELDLSEDLSLDVLTRIGSDKSAAVILRAAGTTGHRDVEPNVVAVEMKEDPSGWGNCLKYIGGGSPRVEAEIKDEASINEQSVIEGGGGEHWRVVRNSEITTSSAGASAVAIEFDKMFNRSRKVRVDFIDWRQAEKVDIGDTVTLCFRSRLTGEEVDEAFRVYRLTPFWSEVQGTKISAELGGRETSLSLSRYISGVDDVKRWVT